MISIVYCTREHNPKHIEHLKKIAGHPKVEVIEYINKGESLTKFYNKALKETQYDVVVFCHDDILIETKQMAKKIIRHFQNTEYGILGVAGTKLLSETGRWWDDRTKMYGRVWHTHEGKKTLSKYSDDQGRGIEEVVVVDGVFFSVMKSRLADDFDKDVTGFHFYDVDFCFRNYLNGVKIGVHTDIVINHMSIGITNDEWENNRVVFSEKFKADLPVKIDRDFQLNHKFKVLIGCLNFNSFTGSELYVYQLAKELVKRGCDVTILSNSGGEIAQRAVKDGITFANMDEPPGYKRGDGKWQIQGQDGSLTPSTPNSLYRLNAISYDIMHLNHTPVTKMLLQLYPELPAISSIHSEVISLEHPVIHDNIKKYIAIRPEIKEFIIKEHNIPEDKIEVIYNPIDSDRFKISEGSNESGNRILFVGTIDYLRKNMLLDLVNKTKEDGGELWMVGKENGVTANEIINGNSHVKYFPSEWGIEKYIYQCDETAGILLGRTTIEGWLCGKKGWIYDVDDKGNILSKALHNIPEDINKFNSEVVVSKIIKEYEEILK